MKIAKHIYIIVISILLIFPLEKLSAQACCSGGVPLGGSFGLGTANKNSWQILFTYDYNAIKSLVNISENLHDDTRARTTHSNILEVNYGISDRFTVTTLIPFIRQERIIESFGGSKDINTAQGFGDVIFMLKYRILKANVSNDWELVVGGGVKLPSGNTNHLNNDGFILAADMQPGSGSLDGIYWMYFNKSKFIIPRISLVSVTTYRFNGKNNSYNQVQQYKFGNEFQFNLGLNYKAFINWPIDLFSFIRYRTQKADLIDGNKFPGSGGKWIYLIPGVNLSFSPKISLRLSGDIPLYRKLEGTQLTTSYKITAALQIKLSSLKKKKI